MYIVGREAVDKFTGESESTDAKENNNQGELQPNTLVHCTSSFYTYLYTCEV